MDYDYEFTIDCEPKAQGRPRTRIVQTKTGIAQLIENIKVRIAYIGHPKEPMNETGPDWSKVVREMEDVSIAAAKPSFAIIYDDPKSAKAKCLFAMAAREFAPKVLIDQAIQVDTCFYMPRPKMHYGTGRNKDIIKDRYANIFHIKKPDIDNLSKLAMDALTGVIWTDDSIVCKGFTEKVYARIPRVEVKIKLLEESKSTLF